MQEVSFRDDNKYYREVNRTKNQTCKIKIKKAPKSNGVIKEILVMAIWVMGSESFRLREEIRKVLSKGKAAGVLRLVFHDAGTFEIDEKIGGMNGSIVFELDRPENKGLKKSLKILEKAKSQIDLVQSVSWADIIALAGAEAVSLCGGPSIPIQLGRIDSLLPDPEGKLPEESLDATSLKQCFERKGFSTQELVALSGAHTLGSKGFGNPTVFDNAYFKILMEKPWLSSAGMTSMVGLPSDRALVEDDECVRWISKYAEDQSLFFDDFKNVYTKLVDTGATWKKSL
ncbi:putative L-ascorbate peroxidase 6 [Datura stramonium]|uniref:L-ascorbate peroxidase 6 n=1 Tax=Datura stramonium TaxID=4076 RepID=A0ABS8SBY7_DATST|nr:putative L-ascorbate peroxidase 6 [Datura stramonium]